MTFSSIITPNRSGVNQNPQNFPNTATLATNSETDPSAVPIFDLSMQRAEALASQLPAYLTQEGVGVNPFDLLVEEVEAECAEQEAVEELLFDLRFCGTQACRVQKKRHLKSKISFCALNPAQSPFNGMKAQSQTNTTSSKHRPVNPKPNQNGDPKGH